MTHDPLCKGDEIDYACMCPLIARVRADERMVVYAERVSDDYHAGQGAFEAGYKEGKAVERQSCIEEIASFYTSGDNTPYWEGFDKGLAKAIALLKMGKP